jgi:hypothetical protein
MVLMDISADKYEYFLKLEIVAKQAVIAWLSRPSHYPFLLPAMQELERVIKNGTTTI